MREDDKMKGYPTCKTCGMLMTECGNRVKIIDGSVTWYDEIFGENEKEHYSDFDLADFCRGGYLTED